MVPWAVSSAQCSCSVATNTEGFRPTCSPPQGRWETVLGGNVSPSLAGRLGVNVLPGGTSRRSVAAPLATGLTRRHVVSSMSQAASSISNCSVVQALQDRSAAWAWADENDCAAVLCDNGHILSPMHLLHAQTGNISLMLLYAHLGSLDTIIQMPARTCHYLWHVHVSCMCMTRSVGQNAWGGKDLTEGVLAKRLVERLAERLLLHLC